MKRHHDPLYGRFSYLVQSTFAEAVNRFADGSDRPAAHRRFSFLRRRERQISTPGGPKMSKRGVILMHDIRARLPGFGVWHLWDEIEASYPTFAFDHQYGLASWRLAARCRASCTRY